MTKGEVVPFTRPDEEIGRVALPRIRRRLAAVERALTDGETGAARRAELRRRP